MSINFDPTTMDAADVCMIFIDVGADPQHWFNSNSSVIIVFPYFNSTGHAGFRSFELWWMHGYDYPCHGCPPAPPNSPVVGPMPRGRSQVDGYESHGIGFVPPLWMASTSL
jgi:hypothetical protein